MRRNYINSAQPQALQTSVSDDDTDFEVISTDGYPETPFILAIERGLPTEEAVLCTSYTSDTFTVIRGYDGTTAISHTDGALIEHTTAAIDYRESGIVRVDETERNGLDGDDLWEGRVIYNTDARQVEVAIDADVPVWESMLMPTGVIVPYAATDAPAGWLACTGAAVSRDDYARLFAVIGTTYGEGDGSTTFNVPDMRRVFPIGLATTGTGATEIGEKGGAFNHTHTNPTTASDGAHTHTQGNTGSAGDHTHTNPTTSSAGAHTHSIPSHTHGGTTGGTSLTTGSAGSHSHSTGGPSANSSVPTGNGDYGSSSRPTSSHTHSTNSNGSHTHSISSHTHSIPTASAQTSGSNGSHTHTQGATGSAGSHTHTNPATASAGAHTHTQGATGTANPPYITLQFIVKT